MLQLPLYKNTEAFHGKNANPEVETYVYKGKTGVRQVVHRLRVKAPTTKIIRSNRSSMPGGDILHA